MVLQRRDTPIVTENNPSTDEKTSVTVDCVDIFPTKIYKSNINIDKQPMIDFLYLCQQHDESIFRSNSTDNFHTRDDLHHFDQFKSLEEYCLNLSSGLFGWNTRIDNMWGMISSPGGFNFKHTHPATDIAGVFYLKKPENSGDIVFENPDPVLEQKSFENEQYGLIKQKIECFEGDLLLFPPWVTHFVEINNSDQDRLAISFNLKFCL